MATEVSECGYDAVQFAFHGSSRGVTDASSPPPRARPTNVLFERFRQNLVSRRETPPPPPSEHKIPEVQLFPELFPRRAFCIRSHLLPRVSSARARENYSRSVVSLYGELYAGLYEYSFSDGVSFRAASRGRRQGLAQRKARVRKATCATSSDYHRDRLQTVARSL